MENPYLENSMSESGTMDPSVEHLLQRLSEPAVSESLHRLLDHMDTISILVESMDSFLRRGDVIADNLAETVGELRHVDFGDTSQLMEKAPKYLELGTKLADTACAMNVDELQRSRVLERLTDSATLSAINRLLDPNILATLAEFSRISSQSYSEVLGKPIQPIGGMFGIARATKDPDVQKTIGFAFAFMKALSKHIR
jgi:uncharacterized protein YjgD (DUF1641 family)